LACSIVVGIDTWFDAESGKYHVNQYTGDESRTRVTQWETLDWVQEVQKRGAGEIVLNMMNQDGVRNGYDLRSWQGPRGVPRAADRLRRRGHHGTLPRSLPRRQR
jgi:cyclase